MDTNKSITKSSSSQAINVLVTDGDLSKLSPDQKREYYIARCESLGLDPASQPLEYIRMQGKEVLYAKRGAADQMAKNARLTREVIEGPAIIDENGIKIMYCKVRGTLPDGRTETSVATLQPKDPYMDRMKCETKAKRRVTLAILGTGMIDESELDFLETEDNPAVSTQVPAAVKVKVDVAGFKADGKNQETSVSEVKPEDSDLLDRLANVQTSTELAEIHGAIKALDLDPTSERRATLAKAYTKATARVRKATPGSQDGTNTGRT